MIKMFLISVQYTVCASTEDNISPGLSQKFAMATERALTLFCSDSKVGTPAPYNRQKIAAAFYGQH